MADVLELQGIDVVINNMKKVVDKNLPALFAAGLKAAGTFLQAESQKIVPVWTGNLKGSAYTRSSGTGFETVVTVGYGSEAMYAIYVHQDLNKVHGKAFNVKYAAQIAAHAKTTKGGKKSWPVKEYYSPRGENQQAMFLITPARNKRKEMLQIIADKVKNQMTIT